MTHATGRFGKNTLPLLLVLSTAPSPAWTLLPCRAQAAADAPMAGTPEQRAAALAGAHGVLDRLSQVDSFPKFADVLTNRSAGTLGIFLTAIGGMAVGFGDMPGAKSESGLPPAQMKAEYDALLGRWGLTENKGILSDDKTKTELPTSIAKDGRRFLIDVGAFLDKTGGKETSSFSGKNNAPKAGDITFTVVSPTDVLLTFKPKPGKKTDPPFHALLEDGQWRLDLGDMKTMLSSGGGGSSNGGGGRDDSGGSAFTKTRPAGVLSTTDSPLAKAFFQAVNDRKTPTVTRMLRQHPQLVKSVDMMGETPLFQSVFFEDLPTMRVLIAAGADVNAVSDTGKRPMDDALFFHKDDPTLLALLRKHGAKPSPAHH